MSRSSSVFVYLASGLTCATLSLGCGDQPEQHDLEASTAALSALPIGILRDLPYPAASGTQRFDLYYPLNFQDADRIALNPTPNALYIHVHGGGWTGGDKSDDTKFAWALAQRGFIVANINYTRSDGVTKPYRIGFDDVHAFVVNYVQPYLAGKNELRIDRNKISIGGGSAGAHMALVQATRSTNPITFNCVVDLSGPTDLVGIFNAGNAGAIATVRAVFGEPAPNDLSPLQNLGAFKGRKLFVLHYRSDTLVPVSQGLDLVARMRIVKPSVSVSSSFPNTPDPAPGTPNHGYMGYETLVEQSAPFFDGKCR